MKLIKTEALIRWLMEVPVILSTYDLLSKKKDGTVTSQAPVVVSGKHLDILNSRSVKLCLAPVIEYGRVIEVPHIYQFAHNQVVVSLPSLVPGEYLPAVKIMKPGKEDMVYIFPVSWVVPVEDKKVTE